MNISYISRQPLLLTLIVCHVSLFGMHHATEVSRTQDLQQRFGHLEKQLWDQRTNNTLKQETRTLLFHARTAMSYAQFEHEVLSQLIKKEGLEAWLIGRAGATAQDLVDRYAKRQHYTKKTLLFLLLQDFKGSLTYLDNPNTERILEGLTEKLEIVLQNQADKALRPKSPSKRKSEPSMFKDFLVEETI